MDLGKPLVEYGPVNFADLREKMQGLPKDYWEVDRASRVKLAGNRPGNAVFFYNDTPPFLNNRPLEEARSGHLRVLRYPERGLFAEIDKLIDEAIKPLFKECDVMRVQLAELPPGQIIRPHRDTKILSLIHRLHVPIVTHPDVVFTIAGQTYRLEEGNLYDLNNAVIHSVENRSDVLRVHLMVDMLPHTVARARYFDTESEMVAAAA
jgi:hypothetical protein